MPQDYKRATYSRGIKIGKPTYHKVYGEKRTRWACGTQRNPWQHEAYPRMPQISEEEYEARDKLWRGTPEEKEWAKKWLEENKKNG